MIPSSSCPPWRQLDRSGPAGDHDGRAFVTPLVGARSNPLIVGLVIFVMALAGAFAGWTMRRRLPGASSNGRNKKHCLGLHGNGRHYFGAGAWPIDLERQQLLHCATLSAQILRLDRLLYRYGSDADPVRETLRQRADSKFADFFPENPKDVRLDNPSTYELLQRVEDGMLGLKPTNSRDQWWLGQAMALAGKIGDARWLMSQQVGEGKAKDVHCSTGFLVDLTVRQLWSVCA
jgi:hypothetical protein